MNGKQILDKKDEKIKKINLYIIQMTFQFIKKRKRKNLIKKCVIKRKILSQ